MSKNENSDPAMPGQGTSGGDPAVRVEEPQPADQNNKQRVPAATRRPWSGEVIAVVSTGVAVFGAIVALFVATMIGFNSLSERSSQEQRHREVRLETVRSQLDNRIDAIRQTVDENLDAQNSRIHAIERDQARLEGTVDGMK